MKRFFTPEQEAELRANGIKSDCGEEIDPNPVIRLFSINGAAIWLISELPPFYEGMAFGLCDLGMGHPELGDVYLPELESIKQRNTGIPAIERDLHFDPQHPLSVFTEAAKMCREITEDPEELVLAKKCLELRL